MNKSKNDWLQTAGYRPGVSPREKSSTCTCESSSYTNSQVVDEMFRAAVIYPRFSVLKENFIGFI